MAPRDAKMTPRGGKITPRGGKMTPRGRFGDQLCPGSDPDRGPGGVRVGPGAKRVDLGGHLGGPKGAKIYQNEVTS